MSEEDARSQIEVYAREDVIRNIIAAVGKSFKFARHECYQSISGKDIGEVVREMPEKISEKRQRRLLEKRQRRYRRKRQRRYERRCYRRNRRRAIQETREDIREGTRVGSLIRRVLRGYQADTGANTKMRARRMLKERQRGWQRR